MKSLLILILIFSYSGMSAEKDANVKEEQENKRVYSEDEFKKAVYSEIEKRMKRIKKENVVDFSMELLKKEDKLKLSVLELQKKKEQLKKNIEQFGIRVKEFRGQQEKLIGCIGDIEKKTSRRIVHIVDIMSGMRPANAAQVLSVQDPEISVKILDKLDAQKVSKIFNLMDKEISARLQKQYLTMKR